MKNWFILIDPYEHISLNRKTIGNRLEKFFIKYSDEIKKSLPENKVNDFIQFRTNQLDFLTGSLEFRPNQYLNTEYEYLDVMIHMRCPEEYCFNENIEIYSITKINNKEQLEYGLTNDQIDVARKNVIYLSGEIGLGGDQIHDLKFNIGPLKIDTQNNSNLDKEISQSLNEITDYLNSKVKMAAGLISNNLI